MILQPVAKVIQLSYHIYCIFNIVLATHYICYVLLARAMAMCMCYLFKSVLENTQTSNSVKPKK